MREHKKKNKIQYVYSHIYSNAKEYLSVSIALIIGIVIGVFILNHSEDGQIHEIQDYLNRFISEINESQSIDRFSLFKGVFFNNLITVVLFIFIGSTVIGIPILYALIAYKGFCLSYTVSALIATFGNGKGIIFAFSAIFLQNLIYIPCMLALAVSGLRLYKSIVKDKRRENIKIEILRHIVFSSFIGIIFLLGSFIEAYISTNLIMLFSKI